MTTLITPFEHKERFEKFIIRNSKDRDFKQTFTTYDEALKNLPLKNGYTLEGFSEEFGLHSIHYIHQNKLKNYSFYQSETL